MSVRARVPLLSYRLVDTVDLHLRPNYNIDCSTGANPQRASGFGDVFARQNRGVGPSIHPTRAKHLGSAALVTLLLLLATTWVLIAVPMLVQWALAALS